MKRKWNVGNRSVRITEVRITRLPGIGIPKGVRTMVLELYEQEMKRSPDDRSVRQI